MKPRPIRIFDTTLRDGEQSPGASLTIPQKIEIARQLEVLGVDVIEAGFPISSTGDFQAVKEVSAVLTKATVAGLARSLEKDVTAAGQAVAQAAHPRIHVFCATSEIHLKHKLKRAHQEIVKLSVDAVRLAKSIVDDVEFSPEDASRTEPEFLREVVQAVIEAGATTVNIPDTVGYATPEHFYEIIADLVANVSNISQAVISVHCHNDLGLAVANSLAAVRAGAGQIECTINGLGERAGNCSLEEIVMALKVRQDHYNVSTNINTQQIYRTSRMVSTLTGLQVQRNKAIVGANAFAHEAGIHQHGVLAEATTYEIMRPEDVGVPKTALVLGKHSGRHAFAQRIADLGYTLSDDQLTTAVAHIKDLADKKKEIFREDIEAVVEELLESTVRHWTLVSMQISSGSSMIPTATVSLRNAAGDVIQDAGTGDGPVDAVYSTITRITGVAAKLLEYSIRAITGGKESQGEVYIKLRYNDASYRGRAFSTDIIEASALAYLQAINRIITTNGRETATPAGL